MRSTLVAMPVNDLVQFGDYDVQTSDSAAEDILVVLDGALQFLEFFSDLLNIQFGELVQASLSDCLGLFLGEAEALDLRVLLVAAQVLLELVTRVGVPADFDYLAHPLLRANQPVEDVCSGIGLVEIELGSSLDY